MIDPHPWSKVYRDVEIRRKLGRPGILPSRPGRQPPGFLIRYRTGSVDQPRQCSTSTRKTQGKTRSTKLSRGNLIPRATKTYTIQVSSWPSLEEAQGASQELLDKYGIDSYIQRAFFKDKDEIYYRLRIGSFKEQSAAAAYAKEIQSMTSLPVWVDFIRQEM